MAKKYPKVTLSKRQYDFIKDTLKKECIAVTIDKTCLFIYGKEPEDIKHAYCSPEYNTIQYIVRAILGNYHNRLNIVEEV